MTHTMLRRLLQVGFVLAATALLLGLTAGLVAADPGNHARGAKVAADGDSTRPGWGCGDTNHTHTGPPGNPGADSPCGRGESEGEGSGQASTQSVGATTHFDVSAPSNATAGNPFTFQVTAKDSNNNTVTNYGGTVHFTTTDPSPSLFPGDANLTNGTLTVWATLTTLGNQTITARDTANSSITGTSGNISVSAAGSAGTATHFLVSAPSNVTAGNPFTFTVTAQDSNNNTATGYSGTVHFTTTDGSPSLFPGDANLTNGTLTVWATLNTLGNQTITARDTANSSITGTSGNILVSSSTLSGTTHFDVAAPASATAGNPFTFTVTAKDASNNTVTGYSGTVHFTTTDGSPALFPGDANLTDGTLTVWATLTTLGNQTITATDTSNSSVTGTSGNILVGSTPTPPPAGTTHFTVSAPSSVDAGSAFNFTVTAVDQNGATITGYDGTVHFTASGGSATLPGDSKLTNGTGTFSATFDRRGGNRTITATDTGNSSITGTSGRISVR